MALPNLGDYEQMKPVPEKFPDGCDFMSSDGGDEFVRFPDGSWFRLDDEELVLVPLRGIPISHGFASSERLFMHWFSEAKARVASRKPSALYFDGEQAGESQNNESIGKWYLYCVFRWEEMLRAGESEFWLEEIRYLGNDKWEHRMRDCDAEGAPIGSSDHRTLHSTYGMLSEAYYWDNISTEPPAIQPAAPPNLTSSGENSPRLHPGPRTSCVMKVAAICGIKNYCAEMLQKVVCDWSEDT